MESTVTWKKNIKFFRSCCKNVFYPKASKKRKAKKKATSEVDDEEASEPQPKKAKKEKAKKEKSASQVAEVGSSMPTIQEEVEDLEPIKIIEQRTWGKKYVGSSGSIPVQPKINNLINWMYVLLDL